MSIRLFVYGTLAPGHDAWAILEPWAVGEPQTDAVAGVLYDTGRGYPAATFGPADTGPAEAGDEWVVHGVVVTLDPDRTPAALSALDSYEGSQYERITVRTVGGVEAAAYAWIAPLQTCRPVPGGRWTAAGPDLDRQAETPGSNGR